MPRKHKGGFAVIGGGIAGVCTAELLSQRGYNVVLFEKSGNIGGCAGSFYRNGFRFNIGATTVAGLLLDYPVRKILSSFNLLNELKFKNPGLIIHTERGKIKRYLNLKETIEEINCIFPHKNNEKFWKTVYDVTNSVLCHEYLCNFSDFKKSFKTFWNIKNLIFKNFTHFLIPAKTGLKLFFDRIDKDYYDFMDSHVKIVSQSSIERINFLTLLISLGYAFTGIGYPKNGMGGLIKSILKITPYYLKSEIEKIKKFSDGYLIKGSFGEEKFENIVIACPILENTEIFEDKALRDFFYRYKNLITDNSAFLVYGVLKQFYPEEIFNLIINSELIPFATSRYVFVSFENPVFLDNIQYVPFTASVHTSLKYWINLSKEDYDKRKALVEKSIINIIKETFKIDDRNFVLSFCATSETFYKYLGRRSVGGIPIERKNPFWRILSNFTPFKGLYVVGDSSFSYQGWIGISMGILNLLKGLNEKI